MVSRIPTELYGLLQFNYIIRLHSYMLSSTANGYYLHAM